MNDPILKCKDFYVTSDTWFGREQILQIANRKYNSIEEMNKSLIKEWNKTVGKNDIVFHLGNFAWDPHTAEQVLKKLNGTIYFLMGTADDALNDVHEQFKNVVIIEDQIVHLPLHDTVISHYPLRDWGGKESGTLHVHGHSLFNNLTDLKAEKRFNVCCDHWGFRPIKLSTLKDFINEKI